MADSFLNFNEPEYANQEPKGTINPSPYYYADLLQGASNGGAIAKKPEIRTNIFNSHTSNLKQYTNILDPLPEAKKGRKSTGLQKRHSITERDVNRCDTFSSTTSDDSNCTECRKRRELRGLATNNNCDSIRSEVPSPAPGIADPYSCCVDYSHDNQAAMAPHRLFRPGCLCVDQDPKDDSHIECLRPRSVFYVHQDGEDECVDCSLNNISSYLTQQDPRPPGDETPFYGNVSRSAGDLVDGDQLNINSAMLFDLLQDKRDKCIAANKIQNLRNCDLNNKLNENDLTIDLQNLNLSGPAAPSSTNLPIPRYTHSPPSTAPLPVKFSGNHGPKSFRNSMGAGTGDKSTDHLGETPARRERGEHGNGKKASARHASKKCAHSMVLPSDRVLQLKQNSRRARHNNFSSNESMTTSSSVGSMESIRSSTSEGNCSTSSTESHLTASLSSHSSDSSSVRGYPLRTPVIVHANMNILSPISDKSLEPLGEMVDNAVGAKKSLQLFAPGGAEGGGGHLGGGASAAAENQKAKRRYLQNRASLLLKDEIQGSDSGISLQSRDETKSKNLALHNFNKHPAQHLMFNNSELSLPEDITNLPFDMPKLRGRKLVQDQVINDLF